MVSNMSEMRLRPCPGEVLYHVRRGRRRRAPADVSSAGRVAVSTAAVFGEHRGGDVAAGAETWVLLAHILRFGS